MRLTKACATAVATVSLAASSQAQLQGFFNTGQNTKLMTEGKVTWKLDQSWVIAAAGKPGGDPITSWVVAPYADATDKVAFVTPPKNVHWLAPVPSFQGWTGEQFPFQPGNTYTYTEKFSVGKLGANDFDGQYASFEDITSLTLNGNKPGAGASNTFTNKPVGKAGNSFNAWTQFSFGNLKAGAYTLIATLNDDSDTGMFGILPFGKKIPINPVGFVLQASATTPTSTGPEPVPEPVSLIALPIGLLLLRRRRSR